MSMMQIITRRCGGVTVVDLVGEIDGQHRAAAQAADPGRCATPDGTHAARYDAA